MQFRDRIRTHLRKQLQQNCKNSWSANKHVRRTSTRRVGCWCNSAWRRWRVNSKTGKISAPHQRTQPEHSGKQFVQHSQVHLSWHPQSWLLEGCVGQTVIMLLHLVASDWTFIALAANLWNATSLTWPQQPLMPWSTLHCDLQCFITMQSKAANS